MHISFKWKTLGPTGKKSLRRVLDLDLDLYIAGTILAIFAMELGERNTNTTCT